MFLYNKTLPYTTPITQSTNLNNNKSSRKKILRDPLAALLDSSPDANQNTVNTLKSLSRSYADLKLEHKKLKNKSNETSRLIGQALKDNKTVSDLKLTMKDHSVQLKTLKTRLSNTEKQILECFIPDKKANRQTDIQSAKTARWKKPCRETDKVITVSLMQDDMNEEWNHYVRNHPTTTIYHRAEWKRLIQQSFGHKGYYFVAHNEQQKIVGILPLIHIKSWLFGNFFISMPYFNYGGAVANQLFIENKLISEACSYAKKLGADHIEYRDDIPREKLPVRRTKVNMILDLPQQPETLWSSFPAKLRSQIRRPQKEETTVHCGTETYLDDFYKVFTRNMRDLGTPVYSKSFFKNILRMFPESSQIIIVRLKNRPVAAGFLLGNQDILEIPWASTIRDVNHLSINSLLYWEALKFAIQNKYKYFDFGRSSLESGTYRFKKQWGANPKQSYWHYWLADNVELPKLNPDNPKFSLAIRIWKRLPLFITKWLGPPIVKNLP